MGFVFLTSCGILSSGRAEHSLHPAWEVERGARVFSPPAPFSVCWLRQDEEGSCQLSCFSKREDEHDVSGPSCVPAPSCQLFCLSYGFLLELAVRLSAAAAPCLCKVSLVFHGWATGLTAVCCWRELEGEEVLRHPMAGLLGYFLETVIITM